MLKDWRGKVDEYQKNAISLGVDVVDVDKSKRQRFLGLQVYLDQEIAKGVVSSVQRTVPDNISSKIFWHSPESIHITLQASIINDNKVEVTKLSNLISDLELALSTHKLIDCYYIFPLFAKSGLIGIGDDAEGIYELRKLLTEIWIKNDLTPTLGEEFWNFPYSFLGRFKEVLSLSEREVLLNLNEDRVPVKLKKVRLCISDKFISPDTLEVIKEFDLI